MIDSRYWLAIGQTHVSAGPRYCSSAPWSLQRRLWLQIMSSTQNGSYRIQDILASFVDSYKDIYEYAQW